MKKLSSLLKRSARSCTQMNTDRYLGGASCFSEAFPFQSQCMGTSADMKLQTETRGHLSVQVFEYGDKTTLHY